MRRCSRRSSTCMSVVAPGGLCHPASAYRSRPLTTVSRSGLRRAMSTVPRIFQRTGPRDSASGRLPVASFGATTSAVISTGVSNPGRRTGSRSYSPVSVRYGPGLPRSTSFAGACAGIPAPREPDGCVSPAAASSRPAPCGRHLQVRKLLGPHLVEGEPGRSVCPARIRRPGAMPTGPASRSTPASAPRAAGPRSELDPHIRHGHLPRRAPYQFTRPALPSEPPPRGKPIVGRRTQRLRSVRLFSLCRSGRARQGLPGPARRLHIFAGHGSMLLSSKPRGQTSRRSQAPRASLRTSKRCGWVDRQETPRAAERRDRAVRRGGAGGACAGVDRAGGDRLPPRSRSYRPARARPTGRCGPGAGGAARQRARGRLSHKGRTHPAHLHAGPGWLGENT